MKWWQEQVLGKIVILVACIEQGKLVWKEDELPDWIKSIIS